MFITFSKTIARVGGFRMGVGQRITKKNWWYFIVFLLVYWMCKLMLYALLASLWVIYAMCYGLWWCCKKIVLGIIHLFCNKTDRNIVGSSIHSENTYSGDVYVENRNDLSDERKKFCAYCGAELSDGNRFCGKCGKPI